MRLNLACERPPAGRFAPRLSPFVRGTLQTLRNAPTKIAGFSVPLTKGDSRGAKRPAGGRSHIMFQVLALSLLLTTTLHAQTAGNRLRATSPAIGCRLRSRIAIDSSRVSG
jgi:hypothetical protein